MDGLLDHLVVLDRSLMEAAAGLRWSPMTGIFVLASAWWVKGPLFVAAAFGRDVWRRTLPLAAFAVVAAFALGDLLSGLIKQAVGRARPPIDAPERLDALVSVPSSPSFPSGHATTSFAAATAVAVLIPRWRWPALGLAALIGVSRIYLGVHYTLDVLAGAALGTLVGVSVALAARYLQGSLAARPATTPDRVRRTVATRMSPALENRTS